MHVGRPAPFDRGAQKLCPDASAAGAFVNVEVGKVRVMFSLGSRLLGAVIDWCKTRDVHAIILWPTERSRSLYERNGFAVRDDIMELIMKSPR